MNLFGFRLVLEPARPSPDFGCDDPYILGLLGESDRDREASRGRGGVVRGPGLTGDVRTHHGKGF